MHQNTTTCAPHPVYKLLCGIMGILFLAVWSQCSFAAAYPDRPVSLVIPYGTGGVTDIAGRTLATTAQGYLGQPLMVVNKVGASGATGSAFVARAKPDGYTLLMARVGSQSVYPAQNHANKLYEWDDFTILSIIDLNPYVFIVHKDSPYKTFNDLADAIKAQPGKLKYSHSGPATVLALGPQMLIRAVDAPRGAAVGVPFTSDGDCKVALLGGHVDFLGVNVTVVLDQIHSGNFRALSVVSKERLSSLPDVPTVSEAGFPDLMTLVGWSGLYGPPNMPVDVVETWQKVLQQVGKDPAWNAVTQQLGNVAVMYSPEESKEFVRKQIEAFKKVYSDMK